MKCNQINIDIDTGTTTTTRQWQIKVTQYECGSLMAPDLNCLQYLTATSGQTLTDHVLKSDLSSLGTIASFNWDTSSSSVSSTQYHLSSQYDDICIRRARSYCSVCFSPQIVGTGADASSFGVSAGTVGAAQTNAIGSSCTGVTTLAASVGPTMAGLGDYLDIVALQPSIGTTGTLGTNRICGAYFNAQAAQTAHATACSWSTPFKVGVHFDADDAIAPGPTAIGPDLDKMENDDSGGNGLGYSGFYLAYWQNTC